MKMEVTTCKRKNQLIIVIFHNVEKLQIIKLLLNIWKKL